jgi:hypothetical protein
MLMDLFFNEAPAGRKSRVHFHGFMAGVHAFIHAWRQQRRNGSAKGDDPVAAAADAIAQKSSLLCFDEFGVTDIADAMILGRLFEALLARGIATSNVRSDLLYQDGLNRALFLPFIAMLEERMQIIRLEARTDFQLQKLRDDAVYFAPPRKRGGARRRVSAIDRGGARRPNDPRCARPRGSCAEGMCQCGTLQLCRSLRNTARARRFSGARAAVPYRGPRCDSGYWRWPARRSQTVHHADRHFL